MSLGSLQIPFFILLHFTLTRVVQWFIHTVSFQPIPRVRTQAKL